MEYKVVWEIDITADSAYEAAEKALEIQHNLNINAVTFDVYNENGDFERINLEEYD